MGYPGTCTLAALVYWLFYHSSYRHRKSSAVGLELAFFLFSPSFLSIHQSSRTPFAVLRPITITIIQHLPREHCAVPGLLSLGHLPFPGRPLYIVHCTPPPQDSPRRRVTLSLRCPPISIPSVQFLQLCALLFISSIFYSKIHYPRYGRPNYQSRGNRA